MRQGDLVLRLPVQELGILPAHRRSAPPHGSAQCVGSTPTRST